MFSRLSKTLGRAGEAARVSRPYRFGSEPTFTGGFFLHPVLGGYTVKAHFLTKEIA